MSNKIMQPDVPEKMRIRISRARTMLVLDHPFFGVLALKLKVVFCTHVVTPQGVLQLDTAATDGVHCFWNPAFVEACSDNELIGVWAHEVMHLAAMHHTRQGNRDPDLWNDAGDYAINITLVGAKFTLPNSVLINQRYCGWAAEQIYNDLLQRRNGGGPGGRQTQPGDTGQGHGGQQTRNGNDGASGQSQAQGKVPDNGRCGAVLMAPAAAGPTQAPSPAELAQHEVEWQIAITQAAQAARAAGKLPAGIESLIEEVRRPKIDWRAALRRFIDRTNPSDYSWSRPNRRFIAQGLYLPSIVREGVGELVVVRDTSASVSDATQAQFNGEISAILNEIRPLGIWVLDCDLAVHRAVRYEPGDEIAFTAMGRGGTDFCPPFRWVEEKGIDPKALIYLTDMEGHFPSKPPHYPVLWVSTERDTEAPFGEITYIEADA